MFETTVRVQYFDTDKMMIVHHANYIRFFEIARTEYLRAEGMSYSEMEKEDFIMPVLSVSAEYKEPAVYDEEIVIGCRIAKISHASMEIEYEIRGKENGKFHAKGKSRHGFTNRALKPIPLKKKQPDIYEFLTRLYENEKD
ncbi:MAG: thioesterase family protein [Eubacteriales bacterium]|nr:thioesterase family protein [Eubacteriales bacterium]